MVFEPSRLTSYDRDAILDEVKRVVQKFDGRAPTHKEFNRNSRVHSATVVRVFGSWEAAMRAVGLDYVRSNVRTAELIADLRRVLRLAGGRYFTTDFYVCNGGRFSLKTLKSRLGYSTWESMLEGECSVRKVRRVLFKKNCPEPPSKQELLAELMRVWTKLGSRPTYGEFKAHGTIGTKVYERVFGSWTRAVLACSQELPLSRKRAKFTHANLELLSLELAAIVEKHDQPFLQYKDYKKLGGTYSIGMFQNHFGSWRKAVTSIGLKDGHSRPRPDLRQFCNEDFFAEIQRLWEKLGRQPKSREMRLYGKMSMIAFQDRFGSWMKAVHAFCKDRDTLAPNVLQPAPPTSTESAKANQLADPSGRGQTQKQVPEGTILIQKTTPRAPSLRLRFKVFQRDRFSCRACGRSPAIDPGIVLHADHIIPYSGLGETVLENLQTLCSQCNLGKSDWVPNP